MHQNQSASCVLSEAERAWGNNALDGPACSMHTHTYARRGNMGKQALFYEHASCVCYCRGYKLYLYSDLQSALRGVNYVYRLRWITI